MAVVPPAPEPILDLPTFNLPSQEARESIFGEHEEESDDVFSSSDGNKARVPEMPAPLPPPPLPPPPVPVAVQLPPEPMPVPEYAATVEVDNPFAELASAPPAPPVAAQPVAVQPVVPQPVPVAVVPQAVPVAVVPQPVPVAVYPQPVPTVAPIGATPPSSAGGNPWAGMDQIPQAAVAMPTAVPVAIPTPIPVPVPLPSTDDDSPFSTVEAPKPKKRRDEPEDEDRPAKRSRAAASSTGGNPMFRMGFFILAPYALIATIAAIYGLFLKSSVPAGHPLSNLPDNFGEFSPAERKKSGRLSFPLDGELPADQKVALGGKLEIGQLEITPVGVEERKLKFISEGKSGAKSSETSYANALVLKMKVTNTSDDLLIHPLDPAFNRQVTGSDKVGTTLMVGKVSYPGGAISWPFRENLTRRYEEAQAADATPLKPRESREYVVFTDAKSAVTKAAKDARDSLLWRVQVRRGRIDHDGKDIPVTAIIGVEFRSSDVKSGD